MLIIDGQEFRVVTTSDDLVSTNGAITILGTIHESENLIMLDGTMPKTRMGEVLLHEILHAANPLVWEGDVNILGTRLYAILTGNDLLRSTWMKGVIDGEASAAELAIVMADLDKKAELEAGMAARAPSKSLAGSQPQYLRDASGEVVPGEGGNPPIPTSTGSADGGASADGQKLADDVGPLRRALEGERAENAKLKQRVEFLVKADSKRTEAKQTDLEKERTGREAAERDRDQAVAAARTSKVHAAIVIAAAKVNARNPETVARLVANGDVTVNDDGTISGVDEAIGALRESEPYLFGPKIAAPKNDATSGTGTKQTDPNPHMSSDPQIRQQQIDVAKQMGVVLK